MRTKDRPEDVPDANPDALETKTDIPDDPGRASSELHNGGEKSHHCGERTKSCMRRSTLISSRNEDATVETNGGLTPNTDSKKSPDPHRLREYPTLAHKISHGELLENSTHHTMVPV